MIIVEDSDRINELGYADETAEKVIGEKWRMTQKSCEFESSKYLW